MTATKTKHGAGPLAEYVRKRDFSVTPEPRGTQRGRSKRLRFVVQQHRATRLHWDFRLEAGGVMPSWAVAKGPTLVAGEKRLAMKTEDHPLDYRTFEGVIPEGYGAGEVIVWDDGTYELAEGDDARKQIAAGKLKIVLHGKKLNGLFTLVKIKPRPGEHGEPWLLFKDHDEYEDPNYKIEEHGESVKSGQTLAELQQSRKDAPIWKSNRAAAPGGIAVKRAARQRAAEHADAIPRTVTPMLTTLVDAPFDDENWLFELKWDGYRAIAVVEKDGVTLTSRNGKDLLAQFPEMRGLATSFRSLPIEVDGELCVLDENGKPDFQALQARDKAVRGLARRTPSQVVFVVFDLIYADGRDLRKEPLEERKRLLESLIVPERSVMYSKHAIGKGVELFALAEQRGLEGIVGKLRTSPYRSGVRSREWVKIKAKRRQEFVIGGYTEPRGSRKGFGAILVGYYDGDDFVYAGHVGTGFNQDLLRDLMARFKPLERKTSPFADAPKTNTPAHWLRPELVCEVAFAEWTREGILRQPVFLGLRIDKDPRSVVREREQHGHAL